MVRHIVQRLLVALVLVVGAATLVFVLLHAVPGDPVRLFLGDFATEDQITAVRAKMGLDRPLAVQYVGVARREIARGDLGQSLAQTNVSVSRLIMDRLPRTLEVAGISIALGLIFGMPIGILAALRRGRPEDVGLTTASLLSLSIPAYVGGTVLVLIFAVWLRWLPAFGIRELRGQSSPAHPTADPAVRHAGFPPGGQHRPADSLVGAGGHQPGLRPHRPWQGAV